MSEVIAVLQCPRCSEIALMSNPLFIIKLALLCLNAWTLSAGKSFSTRIFFNCLLVKLLSFHIVWYCFIESCTKFAPKHNFRHRENPETVVVSGFLSNPIRDKLSLGELRCAAGGLQAVLLTLTWQKPLYLQRLAGLTNEICRRFCLLRCAYGACGG